MWRFNVADAPVTLVVIISRLETEFFPNPVQLTPGSVVKWHCNPIPGLPQQSTFNVKFPDPNPFNVDGLDGMVGGTTPEVSVLSNAKLGNYNYRISIAGRSFDPEIIIEEAMPEPRAKTAQASR
jgi:hypothetical protein